MIQEPENQVNPSLVIESLTQQIAGMARDIAILNAMVAQQKQEIDSLKNVSNNEQ